MAVRASFCAAFLTFVFACLTAASLSAQKESKRPATAQSSPKEQRQEQFTFKTSVDRVVVDVVVNDANGKPVRGLSKGDFSVYEDAKKQDILSFDVHSLESEPGYFAKLPPMPPNTFVNIATEPEKGPLYILLLDLVHTATDDQPYARQQLLRFIDSKPEGTRFAAFVLSDSLYLVEGFTANRTRLHEALDPYHPKAHVPRIFLLGENYRDLQLSSVFSAIAFYIDGLPGRKNILWYSESFPLDLFPRADDPPDKRARVTQVLDALTRVNGAIYPVDVSGVIVFPKGIFSPWDNYFVEDEIANFTGGRAFYSRNDLGNMLQEATEDGANYYTLTYSPSNRNFNGEMRNILVHLETAHKGIQMQYRRGYLATAPPSPIMPEYTSGKDEKEDENLKLRPIGDAWSAYMQRGAPLARQVYFRAHVKTLGSPQLATAEQMSSLVQQPTYFHLRQKKRPQRPIAPVQVQTYLIEYQIIGRVPHLEVAAGAYGDDNQLLNADVQEATSARTAPAESRAKPTYFRVNQQIDVPLTAVSLRLGVHDLSTDGMGTLEVPLPLAPEPDQIPVASPHPIPTVEKQ